ncbi:Enolase [Symbiodinium microadriaticum]|uniref:Enolase n=1 Tax=Symbiodinium microadriaticum TaxID=2951 RepID=A0A1Q9DZ33_SYMMI|nr:Enolase [Symbiodinium microadriaticum]
MAVLPGHAEFRPAPPGDAQGEIFKFGCAIKDLLAFLRCGAEKASLLEAADKLIQLPDAPTKDLALSLGILGRRQLWQAATLTLRLDASCVNPVVTAFERLSVHLLRVFFGNTYTTIPFDQSLVMPIDAQMHMYLQEREPLAWGAFVNFSGFDSGNPAIQVEVTAEQGVFRARVPGSGENKEFALRDGATDQQGIDKIMLDLDGTEDKTNLGADAILGVSLACCRHHFAVQCDTAAVNAALSAAAVASTWSCALATGSWFLDISMELDLIGRNILIHASSALSWPKALAQAVLIRGALLWERQRKWASVRALYKHTREMRYLARSLSLTTQLRELLCRSSPSMYEDGSKQSHGTETIRKIRKKPCANR